MNFQGKKLYRSREKIVSGICGGVANYLEVDPTVIRLLWIIFSLMGVGIIVYLAGIFIVPEEPADYMS